MTDLEKPSCKSLEVDVSFKSFSCFHVEDPLQALKADFTSTLSPVEKASSNGISAQAFP